METYIVRIIDSTRSQFNLSGFLFKEKLNLNIFSNEENISVEATGCDKFPKSTISIESDLFFGKSIDMCEDSIYIELTNIELLEMMPGNIKVDGFLVKFADLLDADMPRVCLRSEFDSDIPDKMVSTVPEAYRPTFIHTEDGFAYKYCMSRQQQKQVKQKRKVK